MVAKGGVGSRRSDTGSSSLLLLVHSSELEKKLDLMVVTVSFKWWLSAADGGQRRWLLHECFLEREKRSGREKEKMQRGREGREPPLVMDFQWWVG